MSFFYFYYHIFIYLIYFIATVIPCYLSVDTNENIMQMVSISIPNWTFLCMKIISQKYFD